MTTYAELRGFFFGPALMVSSLHYCRRLEPVVRLKPNWRFGVDGHGGIINGLSLEKKRRNPKKKKKESYFSPGTTPF